MNILIVIGTAIGIIIATILALCIIATLIKILDSDYGGFLMLIPIAIGIFYLAHDLAVHFNWIEPFIKF